MPRGRSRVGERFEVEVGPVAHGGHCVARVADGDALRVIFVRHTLPGERVVLEITEGTDGDRFWRGDAVEILTPSSDRVAAPCPYAGPARCGGCDFQHVSLAGQRELKTAVVREQLKRLAGIDSDVVVEEVAGAPDGLRWRTRQRYVDSPAGRAMRKFRSHDLIPIDDCLIARTDAREPVPGTVIETVTVADSAHDFTVAADGFWQVHPSAPATLVAEVLRGLDPQPGESVLDLYAGVGLFSAFLADRVGTGGRVVAIEGDRTASTLSARNLPDAEVTAGDVATVLASAYTEDFDLVVLDPPREGARRPVVDAVVARGPRAIAYVACDPAALARDLALFAERGYELRSIRAFDLFPMTSHVECVAQLVTR
ncbi:class I SAM-dependent RNA methyltransferase [Nocardioides sp. Kera G14]|uniref:class I SAM-dependent RNA methyltransferase n=1 Tax=Nocardioides sp. Kera G14 TaxID=2884264 RepID=UPI001D12B93C|nr:TRAM domain-containing protein [Nocardioides sp. Kera G14]UDY25387.1 methyltransferase [Nocardioides sp. Kera G14]